MLAPACLSQAPARVRAVAGFCAPARAQRSGGADGRRPHAAQVPGGARVGRGHCRAPRGRGEHCRGLRSRNISRPPCPQHLDFQSGREGVPWQQVGREAWHRGSGRLRLVRGAPWSRGQTTGRAQAAGSRPRGAGSLALLAEGPVLRLVPARGFKVGPPRGANCPTPLGLVAARALIVGRPDGANIPTPLGLLAARGLKVGRPGGSNCPAPVGCRDVRPSASPRPTPTPPHQTPPTSRHTTPHHTTPHHTTPHDTPHRTVRGLGGVLRPCPNRLPKNGFSICGDIELTPKIFTFFH